MGQRYRWSPLPHFWRFHHTSRKKADADFLSMYKYAVCSDVVFLVSHHLSYIPMHYILPYSVVMRSVQRIVDICNVVLNKHWISTLNSKTKDLRKFTDSCRHFKYQTIPHVFYTYYLNSCCLIYHYMHVFCDYPILR